MSARGPHVSDGRISVEARTIQMALGEPAMKADTNVRSVMISQSKPKPGETAVKMPSMLKQDQPVNVKSNRLDYDGANSRRHLRRQRAALAGATPRSRPTRSSLEDKTGNLHATTKVVTTMVTDAGAHGRDGGGEGEAKTPDRAAPIPPPTSCSTRTRSHKATYTGNAHMSGPTGDVTADRIELFLAEQGGQLERAEAEGNVVSRQEARRAYGRHLTYIAKDDCYTMAGTPVKVYDRHRPRLQDHRGDDRHVPPDGQHHDHQRIGGGAAQVLQRAVRLEPGVALNGNAATRDLTKSYSGGRSSRGSTSRSPRAR